MLLSWFTLLLLSSPSHAALDEPSEPIEFSRTEPAGSTPGLCPSGPLAGPVTIPSPPPPGKKDTESLLRMDNRIRTVVTAVQSGYNVPDFETVSSGAELITRAGSFNRGLPWNYRFFGYFTEPEFGIKFMILKPGDAGDNSPFILSVIGTQSFLPWLQKFLNGSAADLSLSRVVKMFTTCQYLEEFHRPLAERGVIITGHSIGGGLAETLAYLIQSKRVLGGMSPLKLEVVTFNGFGGKSVIEKMGSYDEKIAALIPARNYFVQGDALHEIGEHIGPLYNLGIPAKSTAGGNSVMYSHLISTVTHLGNQHVMMLSAYAYAPEETVAQPRDLATLNKYSTIVYALPDRVYEHTNMRIAELLNEGALTLELTPLTDKEDREKARFIARLAYSRELSLRDGGGGMSSDNELVRELRATRGRILRAVP